MSFEFLDQIGTRTEDGRRITVEWGEPVATCGVEPGLIFDVYEPVFTATDDGMRLVPALTDD